MYSSNAQEISTDAEKPSLAVLVAISTINPMAWQIYLPSLAGMMVVFSASAGQIQLSMSAFFFAVAIAQLIWGPLSDQIGRRPVIILGMALFVLGTILCLLAPSIEALIAARVIQAAGGCTGMVLGRAIVRDVFGPKQAASMIGYVTMGMTVMPTLAPAIGGLLDQSFGWQGGFVLILIFGLVALWASIYKLPETNKDRVSVGPKQVLASYATLCREPIFWAYALTAAFSALTFFAYLGGAPFIAAGLLSLSSVEMGFYFMFVALGYILGNYLSGKYAERVGMFPMIIAGTVVSAIAVLVIASFTYFSQLTALGLFLPMFLLGLGNGVCLPSALSGAVSVHPELAGSASGLTASLQVSAGAFTGSLVAWLYAESFLAGSAWSMIMVMAIGMMLSLIAAISIRLVSIRQAFVPAE